MKKILTVILVLIILFMLSGCSSQTSNRVLEPDELEMIRTIGIDKGENGYSVTISTDIGLNGKTPKIRSGEGKTVDEALNILKKTSGGQEPFYSHVDNLIIGEEVVREGIGQVLDFMARSSELRIGTNIVISRGTKAKGTITGAAGKDSAAADMLEVIKEQAPSLGRGYMFNCLDVLSGLAENGTAMILAVELTEGDDLLNDGERVLRPQGYAVVEDGKLVNYTSPEETAGITLLLNKLDSLNIEVRLDKGTVGLTLTGLTADIQPVFLDNELKKLKIKVSADASITEAGEVKSLTMEKERQEAGLNASKMLLKNLQETIRKSQSLGIDYMNLGQRAGLKSPMKFQRMKTSWNELFSKIEIELEVSTVIKQTYDLAEPVDISGQSLEQ